MHITGVFGAGYSVLLIRANGKVVHRSVVTPKYFRFPFMAPADLQAGDVWTSEDQQGLGLAGFALRYLLSAGRRGQTYWYLVEEDNVPSVRTAKRSGLRLAGYGGRTSRLGLRLLGTYQIFTRESADAERIVTPIPH